MISLETFRTKFWSSRNNSIGARLKQVILTIFVILGCNLKIHAQSDSVRIVQHLTTITKTEGFRNYRNIPLLNQTAEYIFSVFSQYADTVYYQAFQARGETYMNVVCRFETANDKPLVIVGAHYDVHGNTEGADDNASGVVGLLELVRILSTEKLNYPIEIVAYANEEQPFFLTNNMGSYVHAKSLHDAGILVYGMATFEMIGYFDDRKNSQSYPIKFLKVFFGSKGNFILLTGKTGNGKFARKFSKSYKKSASIRTINFRVPPFIVNKTGVHRSDHWSYWQFDYSAIMITNTAFLRNPNYHRRTDTMETLDIPRMMKVIDATTLAIINLKL